MLGRISGLLISRRTAVTLIVVLLVLTALGYAIPQQGPSGLGPNRLGLPEWALGAAGAVGFDRMFSSPAYLATLGATLISLLAALVQSARLAWRRTMKPAPGAGSLGAMHVPADMQRVERTLRSGGFWRMRAPTGVTRYTKHPWGYWGGFVLHLGLVVSIGAAIVVLSSQTWAIVGLTEGESRVPGEPWPNQEFGSLGTPLVLDKEMRLESVTPVFWDTHELKQITSELFLVEPGATPVSLTISVNRSRVFDGIRFYQDQQFGQAFFLEIKRAGASTRERVEMNWPFLPGEPSYFDLDFSDGTQLQLKYYADSSHERMVGEPELWGRFTRQGVSSESVLIEQGVPTNVGPLEVVLEFHRPWTAIILVRDHGVSALFAGFFLIFIGSGLVYLTVPREALISPDSEGGVILRLRAARFQDMYAEEFQSMLRDLGATREDRHE